MIILILKILGLLVGLMGIVSCILKENHLAASWAVSWTIMWVLFVIS